MEALEYSLEFIHRYTQFRRHFSSHFFKYLPDRKHLKYRLELVTRCRFILFRKFFTMNCTKKFHKILFELHVAK
jgi:hypothetical protein